MQTDDLRMKALCLEIVILQAYLNSIEYLWDILKNKITFFQGKLQTRMIWRHIWILREEIVSL